MTTVSNPKRKPAGADVAGPRNRRLFIFFAMLWIGLHCGFIKASNVLFKRVAAEIAILVLGDVLMPRGKPGK